MSKQKKRKAISYLRYSTKKQFSGGSEKRQSDWADQYCQENNLELVDTYSDLGVSGFKGKHSDVGKLGALIKDCESGKIPKNFILLVENLDRLSREDVPIALQRFLSLINDYKLEIHTLDDNQIYKSGEIDMTQLIISIVIMGRAHGESTRKSVFIGKAWQQKREAKKAYSKPNKKPMGRHPNWLAWDSDNQSWIVDQEAKFTIEYIFKLCIEQKLGRSQIAQRLNAEEVPLISKVAKKWTSSIIQQYFINHALIGIFNPRQSKDKDAKTIEDYYPVIITKDRFEEARSAINVRSYYRGRPSTTTSYSILTGIARYKNSKIFRGYDKLKDGTKKETYNITDSDSRRHYLGFSDQIDHFVTSLITELDDQALSANSSKTVTVKKIETSISNKQKDLSTAQSKLDNLIKAVALSSNIPELVKELEQTKVDILHKKDSILNLEKELSDLQTGSGIYDKATVSKLKDQALVKKDLQSRQELQVALSQLINGLDLYKNVEELPDENDFKNMAIMLQADVKCKYWARIQLFNDAVILGAMTAEGKIARIRWEDPS